MTKSAIRYAHLSTTDYSVLNDSATAHASSINNDLESVLDSKFSNC